MARFWENWFGRECPGLDRRQAYTVAALAAVGMNGDGRFSDPDCQDIAETLGGLALFRGVSSRGMRLLVRQVQDMIVEHGRGAMLKQACGALSPALRNSAFFVIVRLMMARQDREDELRKQQLTQLRDALMVEPKLAEEMEEVLVSLHGWR